MSGGDDEVFDQNAIEASGPPGLGGPLRPASDTSFEVELDEEPPPHAPIYVDVVSREHGRRPIIPAQFRGAANIKKTAKDAGGLVAHRAGFHVARLPFFYIPLAAWYSLVGAGKVAGAVLRWGFDWETFRLQQTTARKDNVEEFLKLASLRGRYVSRRMLIVALGAVALAVGLALLATVAPWWARVAVLVGAVPVLAHVGRPIGKPIVGTAVVAPRYRKLNGEIVLRAYYAAGLGHPEKPNQKVDFLSQMARDNNNKGSQVVIALPYGKTFVDDVIPARSKIASGLDVTSNQVFLTRDKKSDRSHLLYIADVDPLSIPAGRTPLLNLKARDIWRRCPFGLDERDRQVMLDLLWSSFLIGAQPRKGKTFSARLIGLYAALDPYVKITLADGKNSPDWRRFQLVADRIIFGTTPNRAGDPIEMLVDALLEIDRDIDARNEKLSHLPTDICPEGKLTRDIARNPKLGMPVRLLIIEEFQKYFETPDQEANKQIAYLLSKILAVGPSSGVILVSSSQKPSGVGAGDVQRLFNRYRDNHDVRFALKCGNRLVSEAILGGDAYGEGYDASSLPIGPEYRGVGILYGASDDTPIVRTYLADAEDAEKILVAARRHRELAGTLSGMAAGEDVSRTVRDVLADVRKVYYAGEAWISWPQISGRLRTMFPEHYGDLTPDAISAQCRALHVESVDGRDKSDSNKVRKGAKVASVEAAIRRRELDSGR